MNDWRDQYEQAAQPHIPNGHDSAFQEIHNV